MRNKVLSRRKQDEPHNGKIYFQETCRHSIWASQWKNLFPRNVSAFYSLIFVLEISLGNYNWPSTQKYQSWKIAPLYRRIAVGNKWMSIFCQLGVQQKHAEGKIHQQTKKKHIDRRKKSCRRTHIDTNLVHPFFSAMYCASTNCHVYMELAPIYRT